MNTDPQAITGLLIDSLASHPRINRPVSADMAIVQDLALDSLAVMDFVMEIEDKLDVSVPLDRLADIRTVDDLARCLAELVQHR